MKRSIAMRAFAGFVALALALCSNVTAAETEHRTAQGFTYASAPYTFVFPRDHASHPDYQTEWWYYTGHLTAPDGRRFGYELTFFRVGLHPGDPPLAPGTSRWRGPEVFPAHFAITDERGGGFFHDERFAREALGMGRASATALAIDVDGWTLRGEPMANPLFERMTMRAASGANALDLVQVPRKPPAIHGAGGVSRKGACPSCASHYYSYTRLATIGTLRYDGVTYRVRGESWMDHEFGSGQLQADQQGWDWFSLQLADGREVMLYHLRLRGGGVTPQSSGTIVERDGSLRPITASDFTIDVLGSWTSPHTGARYPSGWRIRVPKAALDVTLRPTVPDQELFGSSTTISYWEGAVDIVGADGSARGLGYVELTGYAGAVSI